MDPIGRLTDLFDVNFSPTVDITLIHKEEEETVVNYESADETSIGLNLATLDEQEQEEVIDVIAQQKDEEGRVLQEGAEEETEDMEQGWDEQKAEMLEFFDGLIFSRYHRILEDALYLRGIIEHKNLTKEQIDKRKHDLADRLGGEAIYICNLCTAGYFDQDRTLREIYQQMYLGDEYEEYEFKDTFKLIVTEKLLCVFVERDQTVYEVTQEIRRVLAKYQREDPPNNYVDVRGIGAECTEMIDSSISNLEEEFIGLDYSEFNEDGQRVIRIHPASLPPLGGDYS